MYVAFWAYILFEVFDFSYRWLIIVCCFPALLGFLLFVTFLPESPRYLFVKKEYEQLHHTLQYMQKINGRKENIERLDTSNLNFTEKMLTNEKKSSKNNSLPNNSVFAQIMSLFDEKNKKMFILQIIIWFTLSFGYFGITYWIPSLLEKVKFGEIYKNTFVASGNCFSLFF